MSRRLRVGVDIGGTFTDLIVVDSETGEFTIGKVLTTPSDPSRAVEEVFLETLSAAGLDSGKLQHIIHGTTLVTNAVVERKGAATALLTTRGFRDSIEIGRENRYDLYDLMLENPRPLVPRYLRFDVPQRTLSDGSTALALDEAHVARLAEELSANGLQAVAIVFLHSFTNPAAERAAREVIGRVAPQLRVSISSEVVPEIREFERASTTIANVYVQELVEKYLHGLEERLSRLGFEGSFFLMLSSGGIATVETAVKYPVRLLESGPAAGALAAATYGNLAGYRDLLSFDMGGTTAKMCVISDGKPMIAHEFEIDRVYRFKKGSGLPIKTPVLELIEIGTGGGSIARVDSLGLLKVGPDSAGADPGPACYGSAGTEPTVTDANLILGYLDPSYFLGGRMVLDIETARRAIRERIAGKLSLSIEEAAWGIYQIANENMANAARVHSLERGKDPSGFPLFAFGGAGPMHAYRIALSLRSPILLTPLGAGVTSTVGFLSAPLAFDFVRSWPSQLDTLEWAQANALIAEMEAEGQALLSASGLPRESISHRRKVDMRYVGQGHEIPVPLPEGVLDASQTDTLTGTFQEVYQRLYGRLGPPVPLEVLNWRVVSSGPKPELHLQFSAAQMAGSSTEAGLSSGLKGERPAYFPESNGFAPTPIYDRYRLVPGTTFAGPAIVEERESTVIVGPGAGCHVDEQHNLVIALPHLEGDTASWKP